MNKKVFMMIVVAVAVAVLSVIHYLDSEHEVKTSYNQLDDARVQANLEYNRRNDLLTERGNLLNSENLEKFASGLKLDTPSHEQTAYQIKPAAIKP